MDRWCHVNTPAPNLHFVILSCWSWSSRLLPVATFFWSRWPSSELPLFNLSRVNPSLCGQVRPWNITESSRLMFPPTRTWYRRWGNEKTTTRHIEITKNLQVGQYFTQMTTATQIFHLSFTTMKDNPCNIRYNTVLIINIIILDKVLGYKFFKNIYHQTSHSICFLSKLLCDLNLGLN